MSVTGHLGAGVGFVKLVALLNIQIPPRLCGLTRAIICHFVQSTSFWDNMAMHKTTAVPSSNPFLFRLGFCPMKKKFTIKHNVFWVWLAEPNRMGISPDFKEASILKSQFASLTHFCHWHQAGKEAKYFDHWVWAFVADGLFSSIPFGGQWGEEDIQIEYKKSRRCKLGLILQGFVPNFGTPCVSGQRVEVPCLSNVTRMTVHLNSLLGGFAGVGTQGPRSLDRMGKCVCLYHGAGRGGVLAVLLAQTIGRKKVVRGMCLSKSFEKCSREELSHLRRLCIGLKPQHWNPLVPGPGCCRLSTGWQGSRDLSVPSRFGPTPTLTK